MLRGSLLLLLLASAAANSLVHPHISALGRLSLTKASSTNMRLRGGEPDIFKVTTKPTTPFSGQKPGTSGLRKKTREFMQKDYLANFVQSVFNTLVDQKVPIEKGTLVISGDGRYFNREAIQIIAKIAVAAGVERLWIGQNGLLSTPAASAVLRNREGGFKAIGAFILSASHNPGGIDEDFGIKFNGMNGAPAPEQVTNTIFDKTKTISELRMADDLPEIDISKIGKTKYNSPDGKKHLEVEVFDSTEDHVDLLKKCFDFDKIKNFVSRKDFSMCYDALHGVQGPYAKKVFCDTFGLPSSILLNCEPKEDFGGPNTPSHGHADPNLANARELCDRMGVGKDGMPIEGHVVQKGDVPSFGAAADGDADRNMILGSKIFVSPSDSLAVIADNIECIPFFSKTGLKAAARSMPTSRALDLVCESKKIPCFETPTGWKFFGNLMDCEQYQPFLCGEESFGTGSNHIREKDGMWAVLAWLQILAAKNPDQGKPLVTVEDIVKAHWSKYGRNYYVRYDYEGVELADAEKMMKYMSEMAGKWPADAFNGMEIETADVFKYNDPVDKSVSDNQGIRFIFKNGSRIVFRVSGTGVVGATIRLYLEKYEGPSGNLNAHPLEMVKPIADLALKLSKLEEFTGRKAPSVMT